MTSRYGKYLSRKCSKRSNVTDDFFKSLPSGRNAEKVAQRRRANVARDAAVKEARGLGISRHGAIQAWRAEPSESE